MQLLSIEKLKNFKLANLINIKIVRLIWSAILDDKTCPLCLKLDQKVIDIDSKEAENFQPPLHKNCRCHLIPIISDAEIIPEINWEKPTSDLLVFAPFLFFLPSKKKEIEIDINDIIPIEDYSKAIEKIDEYDEDALILVLFLGRIGKIILEKEVLIDKELELTNREIKLIKDKAVSYMISDDNEIIEDEIKMLFKLKKRFI